MVPLLAALCFLALAYNDVLGRVRTNSWKPGALSGSLLVNLALFGWHSVHSKGSQGAGPL